MNDDLLSGPDAEMARDFDQLTGESLAAFHEHFIHDGQYKYGWRQASEAIEEDYAFADVVTMEDKFRNYLLHAKRVQAKWSAVEPDEEGIRELDGYASTDAITFEARQDLGCAARFLHYARYGKR